MKLIILAAVLVVATATPISEEKMKDEYNAKLTDEEQQVEINVKDNTKPIDHQESTVIDDKSSEKPHDEDQSPEIDWYTPQGWANVDPRCPSPGIAQGDLGRFSSRNGITTSLYCETNGNVIKFTFSVGYSIKCVLQYDRDTRKYYICSA